MPASKELLAIGIFGANSRLGDRIETLLRRNRAFSVGASASRVGAGATGLLLLVLAGSRAPRWLGFAQAPRPHFDGVSIKPTPEITGPGADFGAMVGGRLHVRNNEVGNL